MKMKMTELLAPAGSFDVMKACYSAGADAVYMGLNRFSARAYAANASVEDYTDAIRYAHKRGKKLYLTVNTLFKEHELEEIYGLLAPLYTVGLDAVIVQDLGVISRIREMFPELPVHASTQMTVTGPGAVRILQTLGVKRVIPARELSLGELRRIKEETGIELECFIHGALCYSYSGQCLFSSMAGGRSGNRGRCAQPCRMSYSVFDEKEKEAVSLCDGYVLSLKDLNTLDLLPAILDAGVDSLKIEGRLKKAEYAAGVTSVYRKYLDLYLSGKQADFHVSREDHRILFDLFNRQGFTEGYYRRQNGHDMLTLKEQEFRAENEALTERIRSSFIRQELKVPVKLSYEVSEGMPLQLTASFPGGSGSETISVSSGVSAAHASGKPMDAEAIEKQLKKLGNTDYTASSITGKIHGAVFLPVSVLNEVRRKLVYEMDQALDSHYRRTEEESREKEAELSRNPAIHEEERQVPLLSVRVSAREQLKALNAMRDVSEVILESTIAEPSEYRDICEKLKAQGTLPFLAYPQIFREKAADFFQEHLQEIREAGFSGFLIRSLDGLDFVKQHSLPGLLYGDHTLYGTNSAARSLLFSQGFSRLTLPLELNFGELIKLKPEGSAIVVYGRIPMMVSAGCIRNTAFGCDKKPHLLTLRDRMGNRMPVINDCRYCLNTILNSRPISLLSEREAVLRLQPASLRLDFTVESASEVADVYERFRAVYLDGSTQEEPYLTYTKGHFRRGVE